MINRRADKRLCTIDYTSNPFILVTIPTVVIVYRRISFLILSTIIFQLRYHLIHLKLQSLKPGTTIDDVINDRLANLAQTSGPGWNQLLTAKDMAATRTMQEQIIWMHRLVSTFWTIQVHSSIHMPFVHSQPESKAACLENARSLIFLYECIRSRFTSPGIRNFVAFYGFASAVFLETVSNLPADKKRVERLKEILEEDSQKSILREDLS